jgi:hypothetical protein
MQIAMELITPAKAEELLRQNTRNRRLRKGLVDQYARDMSAGRWRKTHQGIAINCDGTILDGQHRLHAIIQSGVAVEMLVARGVPSSSQLEMDGGAVRTASDVLTIDSGEIVTPSVVAIAKATTELCGGFKVMTRSEVANTIASLRNGIDFVEPFLATKQRGVTSAPVWAAVAIAWFYVDDLDRLHEFCNVLSGREMAATDGDRAAVVLRELLLRTGAKSGRQWRSDAFKKTQRAIVAFMARHDIGKLYGTDVHYPWPLVEPVRN